MALYLSSSFCISFLISVLHVVIGTEDFGGSKDIPSLCSHIPILPAIPGSGWDNLQDQELNRVFDISYTDCKKTYDGKFLIPNHVESIALHSSDIDVSSEVMEHWSNYSSITSKGFNVDVSLDVSEWFPLNISGSYSDEYKEVKRTMVQERSILVRASIQYKVYAIKSTTATRLNPELESMLIDALSALEANNTDRAECLLEFVVRDYGTHFTTKTVAGAALVHENYIDEKWEKSSKIYRDQLKAMGKASISDVFKISFNYAGRPNIQTSDMNEYRRNLKKMSMKTQGGPLITPDSTIDDWKSGIEDKLVTIERSGDSLHQLITPSRFKSATPEHLKQLRMLLVNIIRDYTAYNTHVGCMNVHSPNFEYDANTDGACEITNHQYIFGGAYTSCIVRSFSHTAGNPCTDKEVQNPLTGSLSCPSGYSPTFLHEWQEIKSTDKWNCQTKCSGWWIFKKCWDNCNSVNYQSIGLFKSYWCAQKEELLETQVGYLFGGISSREIIFSNAKSCPLTYMRLRLTPNTAVCVASYNPDNAKYALEFGGLFSCKSSNPLATVGENDDVQGCPAGYKQTIAAIEHHCQINYCYKSPTRGARNFRDSPIIRPPFKEVASRLLQTGRETYETSGSVDAGVVAGIIVVCCIILIVICMAIYVYRYKASEAFKSQSRSCEPKVLVAHLKNSNNRKAVTQWGGVVNELQNHHMNKPLLQNNLKPI